MMETTRTAATRQVRFLKKSSELRRHVLQDGQSNGFGIRFTIDGSIAGDHGESEIASGHWAIGVQEITPDVG